MSGDDDIEQRIARHDDIHARAAKLLLMARDVCEGDVSKVSFVLAACLRIIGGRPD